MDIDIGKSKSYKFKNLLLKVKCKNIHDDFEVYEKVIKINRKSYESDGISFKCNCGEIAKFSPDLKLNFDKDVLLKESNHLVKVSVLLTFIDKIGMCLIGTCVLMFLIFCISSFLDLIFN